MKYQLKLFDITLLRFEIETVPFDKPVYKITYINEKQKRLLPFDMAPTPDGIRSWLNNRIVPENREYADSILSRVGLSRDNIPGIIMVCKCLSLNDSYWVTEDDSQEKFDDCNLFDNKFKTIIARIAFTGYGSSTRGSFVSSPEFTTNGMLPKCWRRRKNNIYLYKGGTSGARNTGNEPYSEFYASQIAEKMGLNHVHYDLEKWKGIICCKCQIFTSKDISFVPMFKFVKNNNVKEISEYLKSLGEDIYQDFASMMIFDSLIYNTDRHLGNFGLLVNSHNHEIVGFAPIFDNGLSLFNYALEDDFNNLEKYAKTRVTSFSGVSFDDLYRLFLSEKQKDQLRKLINFKFHKHRKYNLDIERLKKLQEFIQRRIRTILKS